MSSMSGRRANPARSMITKLLGRSGASIALALLIFTALIWLRLRLVTDVPRQAYAEPREQQQQREDATRQAAERQRARGDADGPNDGR